MNEGKDLQGEGRIMEMGRKQEGGGEMEEYITSHLDYQTS